MFEDNAPLYVYDMDGVITTKNCLYLFLRARVAGAPWRAVRAFPTRVQLARAGDETTRTKLGLALAESALHGLTLRQYERAARRYGRWLGIRPGLVRPDVAARIRRQHADGGKIVIATACERTLAAAVLRSAQVPYDLLSATVFGSGAHGIVVADARYAARKNEALRELNVPIERAHFHTDDFSDHHTALHSARVTLVGASRRTIRRFRNAGIHVDIRPKAS